MTTEPRLPIVVEQPDALALRGAVVRIGDHRFPRVRTIEFEHRAGNHVPILRLEILMPDHVEVRAMYEGREVLVTSLYAESPRQGPRTSVFDAVTGHVIKARVVTWRHEPGHVPSITIEAPRGMALGDRFERTDGDAR